MVARIVRPKWSRATLSLAKNHFERRMVGAMGRYDRIHRGIGYSLHNLGARRWRWEVSPPTGVLGLRMESGEVEGELRDAEWAAQSVIEQQTGQFTL